MRALVDTKIIVRYLLRTGSPAPAPPSFIVRAALAGRFRLVVPGETIDGLTVKVASKPYLAEHIPEELVDSLVELLSAGAEVLPALAETPRQMTRDPGDDYLIAHAVLEQVDYLVTGDKDLLVLGDVAGVQIVSPAGFVAILEAETGS